jgi:glycosyltransferase involved in cell wall biosynthesis
VSLTAVGRPETVLLERLNTVRGVLVETSSGGSDPNAGGIDLLIDLVDVVRRKDDAAAWLLVVGLTGAFPGPGLVRSVRRALALKDPEDAAVWLLDAVAPFAMSDGNAEVRMRVVSDRPLVDVNFTAKSNLLTGIQRVVRSVVAQWHERHDVEFVAWTAHGGGAYRSLHDGELARLLGDEVVRPAPEPSQNPDNPEILVPWGVPLVLTEVPPPLVGDRLAAVAALTDVSVRLVGYDCIPVSSAETVPLAEPEKFGRFLELVKFSDRVAGISRTAAAEFQGFTRALTAQGLPGPRVVACQLPHTSPVSGADPDVEAPERPVVMCVGTVGRRKNQVALVAAAELLWREGLDFEVRVLGRLSSERSPLSGLAPELQSLGRRLVVEPNVTDARIASTLAHARCLVFPSLHEGFGLPIVEALSHGVPVITSDHGSMSEVAEAQGSILVNAEDVDALADAMRDLLTDDALHARLVAEARGRATRTWTEYADDLWQALLA